jgi:tetratricopeptide (TPR) repeat protein
VGITRRIVSTAIAAAVGWCVGWVAGSIGHFIPKPANYPFLAQYTHLPHHVPKYPDGVSFRFAMVQDIIHERFAKHGQAHYRERDRITREALQRLAPDDSSGFALLDDLGTGLERLGRSDEAVAVMRDKLARQQANGLTGRDLYTSYANLGTFLIHGSFPKAASGNASAKARCQEGVALIRKSVEVNPEAHFGREQWQAAIAEFLLATLDDPVLLKTYDCLGNRLDLGIEDILDREINWTSTGYGRPYDPAFSQGEVDDLVPAFFTPGIALDEASHWPEVSPIRLHITKVGAEPGWENVAVPSHRSPVPFDEPMLGLIGMWRQGGGANPHFALALGETMLRVGQRYIAWAAYERAHQLAGRYSNAPTAQKFLQEHCRKRQAQIEQTLASQPRAVEVLRAQFDAELAYGEGFQREYQTFESAKIAAGASINDARFFDDFPRQKESITSRSGPEEWFSKVPRAKISEYAYASGQAWGMFGAGLASIAMSFLSWLRSRPQSPTDSKEPASRGSGSPTDSARADKPLEGRLASG